MSRTVWFLIFHLHIPFKQGNIVDSGAVFSDALAAAIPGDRLEYVLFFYNFVTSYRERTRFIYYGVLVGC
jgi:hypothetical protein